MIVKCPTCEKSVTWDKNHPYKPFCCERCKLIDLGAWADEQYRIAGEEINPEATTTSSEETSQ